MKDEAYWNTKHPVIEQLYEGRPLPNGKSYSIDVRHFIWSVDIGLQKLLAEVPIRGTPDEIASMIQRYVATNLSYKGDNFIGAEEYWLYPAETLKMGTGDCEDGAILIASLLRCAGIPAWRVNVTAGWVQSAPTAPCGGHAYCCYCRELDNEWVVLDWCYYEDSHIKVMDKPLLKTIPFYKEVWFSFNDVAARSHTQMIVGGRVKKL